MYKHRVRTQAKKKEKFLRHFLHIRKNAFQCFFWLFSSVHKKAEKMFFYRKKKISNWLH